MVDYVSVPGTFLDNEEIHLLTTASLATMAAANPQATWDVRRFRPNFFIATPPGVHGLVEQVWVGRRLRMGEATLEISAPTPRCGMTTRPEGELPIDKTILRTTVREGAQNLGVGTHARFPGKVRADDVIELID